MDLLAPVKRFDAVQQQRRWLAIPVAVLKKVGDDQAGNQAALVAYFAFFSLFPLLLVFVTVLGFVLQGDPHAQQSITKSVLNQFPSLKGGFKPSSIHGSAVALVIGIVTSLLSGLAVTNAAQNALDKVWAVPMKNRPSFLTARLRGLALLLLIGGLFIVSTGISGVVSGGLGGPFAVIGGIVVSLLVNLAMFGAAFRLMTAHDVPTRSLRVGVICAAVFWEVLQVFGGYYVGHVVKHVNSSYTQFAVVIGLLVFLHLGAQLTLYAAEINVVLERRLWPRSLFGPPEMPADEQALTALAKVEERSEHQTVDVTFDGAGTGRADERAGSAEERNGRPDPAGEPIRWSSRGARGGRSSE